MTESSFWIHGQAAAKEWEPAKWDYHGEGPKFTIHQGKDLWVHLPVSTPVVFKGKRATLKRVHVLYSTFDQFSFLDNVHVRDGNGRFKGFDNLGWWGDHRTHFGSQTTLQIGWDGLNFGVGISLRFRVDSFSGAGEFTLASVGADFDHDW